MISYFATVADYVLAEGQRAQTSRASDTPASRYSLFFRGTHTTWSRAGTPARAHLSEKD